MALLFRCSSSCSAGRKKSPLSLWKIQARVNKARLVLQGAWDKGCTLPNTLQQQNPNPSMMTMVCRDMVFSRTLAKKRNLTVLQTEVLAKATKTHVGFKSIHETNVDNIIKTRL